MKTITRRTYLKQLALSATLGAFPAFLLPKPIWADEIETQPMPTEREAAAIAVIAQKNMEQGKAPGLSVAIARKGQFVYQRGFGDADKATGERVAPASLFRIASLSKPITSVAIFTLIEQGRLNLDALVFGEQGILKFDYGESYPDRVKKITLRHLLMHTCGGWSNDVDDPMFCKQGLNQKELIAWTIKNQSLKFEPGIHYAYSNFGYCLLGRVIEKITGISYADYVQQAVLGKCGITDMRLAGNTLAQRAANEVVYYQKNDIFLKLKPPFLKITNPYSMNVARMDSHGGWIGTPSDLVRFMMHLGFKTQPSILGEQPIKSMTTTSAANPNYACGWVVTKAASWCHGGSLPGSQTFMVRTTGGLCWAAFTNTRGSGFNLDEMMRKIVKAVPAWNA
ncbi:MAG: serine hydrolase domain-containing protein [Verrucomicrobiota bacterium]